MSDFYNERLPDYVEKRSDAEGLQWHGMDTSLEIMPHMRLNWGKVEKTIKETGKPMGDLGASFSTLPIEAEMRGIPGGTDRFDA